MALTDKLTAIADAIRGKTGGTDALSLDAMVTEIEGIETGGGTDLSVGLLSNAIEEYESAEVTTLRNYAFYYQTSLERVVLPNLTSANYTAVFRNCSALKVADLGVCYQMSTTAFTSCTNLTTVVLRKTSGVCTLLNASAFNSTPFASGGTGGTVYVPSALISEYQAATNWATLYAAGTCNFVAIEGSEYE